MWWNILSQRLVGRTTPCRTRPPAPRRRGTPLRVERLEDRTVPTMFTATTPAELIADINMANLTPGPDMIQLMSRTPFTLNAVNNAKHGATGLPMIMPGEDLTVVGYGAVLQRSAVPGTPAFRLFDVAAGASLRLRNLTLQGGLAVSGLEMPAQGGAVYSQGMLTLEGVIVQGNTAQGRDGSPLKEFNEPGTSALGGGVYSGGALMMTGCVIRNNAAVGGRGAEGSSSIPAGGGGNAFGGGVYVAGGKAVIRDTMVISNMARGADAGLGGIRATGQGIGGGLYLDEMAAVYLDAFTVNHVNNNHASTADDNIHGHYGMAY